jgi:hypothetical protein
MSSFITRSTTFTVTHARSYGVKVTDLEAYAKAFFMGDQQTVILQILRQGLLRKAGYLGTLTVGFKRNDQWIRPLNTPHVTLRG